MNPDAAPPPWTLTGRAYAVPVRAAFPAGAPIDAGMGGPAGRFVGGPGVVLAVRYATSDVGPYDELASLPGRVRFGASATFASVARIVVSTPESVAAGRAHWALPKALATFTWRERADGERLEVCTPDGVPLFAATFAAFGPSLPVAVGGPFGRIAQPAPDGLRVTPVAGWGWARPARVRDVGVGDAAFEGVRRPWGPAFALSRVHLRFGAPERRAVATEGAG
ncbi:MAG: acetoacetate decarboxylase family protein [Trueperaceae bacterium]|nr:acetoacetate decarboxylase family protein [Trueperaceae bacterium]